MLDKNSEKKTFIVTHGFKGLAPSSPVLGQNIMVAGACGGKSCRFMVDRNQLTTGRSQEYIVPEDTPLWPHSLIARPCPLRSTEPSQIVSHCEHQVYNIWVCGWHVVFILARRKILQVHPDCYTWQVLSFLSLNSMPNYCLSLLSTLPAVILSILPSSFLPWQGSELGCFSLPCCVRSQIWVLITASQILVLIGPFLLPDGSLIWIIFFS